MRKPCHCIAKQLIVLEKPQFSKFSLISRSCCHIPLLYGDDTVMNKNVSGLSSTDSNPEMLKLIAQGVINSLFAKGLIRCAPMVLKVVEEGNSGYRIHLDDSRVSLIRVAVEPKVFFAEVVRTALLRRIGTGDTDQSAPIAVSQSRCV